MRDYIRRVLFSPQEEEDSKLRGESLGALLFSPHKDCYNELIFQTVVAILFLHSPKNSPKNHPKIRHYLLRL